METTICRLFCEIFRESGVCVCFVYFFFFVHSFIPCATFHIILLRERESKSVLFS